MAGVADAPSAGGEEEGADIYVRTPQGRRPPEYNIGYRRLLGDILLILSLDTTTRTAGVAVVRDDVVMAEIASDEAITHAQRLPADFLRGLEAAGVRLEELDLLAVAAGPGSFTGVRVGIASMQGLAFARGLRIVPVSTLEALAHEARSSGADESLIAPWVDAQRGEIFAALYDTGGRLVNPPSSLPPAETLHAWEATIGAGRVVFAGDGAIRYRAYIDATLGERGRVLGPMPSLARAVARIAGLEPERAVLPHAVVPLYVRRPDAEIARERSRRGRP